MSELVRFGVSIEEKLLEKFDNMIEESYNNRSEAIRDLIREKLIEKRCKEIKEEVVGSLTLIYNHHQRGLIDKMVELQHDYHHLFKSNLHLHLSHDYCLEVIIVEGKLEEIEDISNKLIALKGIKHGKLTLSTIE
ncbi:CopG family transcriptional regulator [Orenia metallireducens]|jgi:CopG family nickel-responsive transcriptional regulator|uniref:Putative nickel-responsive regulator n=1 Tax=Orenia metallireducens TaxID=1413210 RepID=A0A285GFX2_9FIRM|nr:nickel-responsive transcriptional regulator NikR [Orenia metallireducens]PRX19175.1 CopG family transcriptional regulator [Orenia metallireducens]SNY21251.1 transcriptional regulator, CopG family [Orenia metallireducens]